MEVDGILEFWSLVLLWMEKFFFFWGFSTDFSTDLPWFGFFFF
jgi:hypothetical protein